MPTRIIPVVEGHGDVAAVPITIRRIAQALGVHDIQVEKPIRCPRDKLIRVGELERVVELAARKIQGDGRILILVDANSDCPRDLAPQLMARAKRTRGDIPIAVVLAKHEFEAWFLASLRFLRAGGNPPPNPEEIRGAKERLADLMGAPYSETVDQPAFAAQFDMTVARRTCPSFDKCWRALEWLLTEARGV